MKSCKKKAFRKGLRGIWSNGVRAFRVPILSQMNVTLSATEKESADEVLVEEKLKRNIKNNLKKT